MMKSNYKISIITSTLNCIDALKKTAYSISSFKDNSIQWIIVDAESTDGTLDFIKNRIDLISDWISEPDTGIYHAWNKAIPLIQGDWVMFVGAGDTLPIDWINFVKSRPPVEDIIYGNILVHDKYTTYLSSPKPWNYIVENFKKNMFLKHPGMAHNNRLFKKNKFNEGYRIISDWVFLANSNLQSALYIKDMVQADFYTGGISTTYSGAWLAFKETKDFRKSIGDPINIRESFNWILYILLMPLRDLVNFFHKKLNI